MLPSLTTANIRDTGCTNTVPYGEIGSCFTGRFDFANLGGGKASPSLAFASCLATLSDLVCHIGCSRSDEKVFGVYAKGNVAMVADELTIGDGADKEFVRCAMSGVFLVPITNAPVSSTFYSTIPQPTGVGFSGTSKETCNNFGSVPFSSIAEAGYIRFRRSFRPRKGVPRHDVRHENAIKRSPVSGACDFFTRYGSAFRCICECAPATPLSSRRFCDSNIGNVHTYSIGRYAMNGHKEID